MGHFSVEIYAPPGSALSENQQTGRICYGCEIDPHYVEVALDRWSAITGREPIHEASGETLSQRRKQKTLAA